MNHSSQVMLLVGPERKARIKSYFEEALRGRPRRWSWVVPSPRAGAVRGIANSWEEARDAVLRHIDAMYGEEPRDGGGRHRRAAGGDQPVAQHQPGEATGAAHVIVSPSSGGRHAIGAAVGIKAPTPPGATRDYALAALARPAERPSHWPVVAADLIARLTRPSWMRAATQ
jgi:hypothetical protein